jgi:hypothetical protein
MEQEFPSGELVTPLVYRATQSANITKFAAAFVKAQAEIKGAVKDATNPHFKNKYADLSSVMDACKGSLNKHGIAIIQLPERCDAGRVALTTKLLHESGEWIASTGEIPVDRNGPQAYGSALTYARRYFLSAMVGVCAEDDDGNGADDRTAPKQRQRQQPHVIDPQDDLADDGKFEVLLGEAFEAKGFDIDAQATVIKRACTAKRVPTILKLSLQDRHGLMNAIVTGAFDKAKEKPVPAGV